MTNQATEATTGKVWFGKVCSQPDMEVFYLQRGITSTPIPGQLSLVWKKFTSADNGSFPWAVTTASNHYSIAKF